MTSIPFRRADNRIAPILIVHGEQCFMLDPIGEFMDYVEMRVRLNALLARIDGAAYAARNPPAKQRNDDASDSRRGA